MREDDLGIFARFEGEEADGPGELIQYVFLDDAVDELVHLFRTAFGLWSSLETMARVSGRVDLREGGGPDRACLAQSISSVTCALRLLLPPAPRLN